MPKPKPIKDEEELSESNTTSEDEGPSATSKKRQLDGLNEQVAKKAKTEEVASGSGLGKERQGKTPSVLTNSEGEKYIDLGKKKRATVRSFKGTPLLDIREFYGADDQEKPGKKGISLTLEQWQALRESACLIDQFFSMQKRK